MKNLLYDNFELDQIGEYSDNHGSTFCEPLNNIDDDEDCLRVFWTVFGHLPAGGRNTIGDFDNLKDAGKLYEFLCLLLATHKNYTKLMDVINGV